MAAAVTNTTPQISSKSPTIRRILREAAEISSSPSPDYTAEPLETDLFEWHFTLRGPPNSVYSQGIYHGRILLPPSYPLRPPSFRFTTPNGRFEANREICLSISGHHEETWQPAWGIRTAIVALRSFMETDARGQLGGVDTTDMIRRRLAQESGPYFCQTCARSNAQIIAEAEERARKSSACPDDVQIPQELSMGWRDEMEASKKAKSGRSAQAESSDTAVSQPRDGDDASVSDSAELAEGFVGTVARSPAANHALPASLQPSQPAMHRPRPQQQAVRPARPNHGVPLWIDRAIVAMAVLLAAMLLRVFLRM